MATFKVLDREFELKQPRGRNGRKATNYLLKKASSAGEGIDSVLLLTEDDVFLDQHLPAFVGKEDAVFIDENASDGEMLAMIMLIVNEVFSAFQTEEVDAALKNLPEAPAKE